jgi:hypothetical protein
VINFKFKKNLNKLKKIEKQKTIGFVIIIVLAFVGVKLLTSSHAQSPYASSEAETGTLGGIASVQSDPNASGGEYVRFGYGVTDIVPTLPASGSTTNTCSTVAVPSSLPTYNTPIPAVNSTSMPAIEVGSTSTGYSLLYTATLQPFVPRGADYVRLTTMDLSGNSVCFHSMFDTIGAPDIYNPNEAAGALLAMHNLGYNVVHIAVNSSEIGLAGGYGLNPNYLANLASFINIARADQIRVWLTTSTLPTNGGYLPTQTGDVNNYFLYSDWIASQQRYLSDLISGLRTAGANMSDIFSFEIWGEQSYDPNTAPLNMTSGDVLTAGSTTPYDMSSQTQKNDMMDVNLINWENLMTSAIHSDLPGSLVSISFFSPSEEGANRIVRPALTFTNQSKVDFVDMHMYPVWGELNTQLSSFDIVSGTVNKPIILGEFGAYDSGSITTSSDAATQLVSWEQDTCLLTTIHITGWSTWTWDTQPWEQAGYYNMTQDSDTIANALSPVSLPNPCK